jgi:hypothetical protein
LNKTDNQEEILTNQKRFALPELQDTEGLFSDQPAEEPPQTLRRLCAKTRMVSTPSGSSVLSMRGVFFTLTHSVIPGAIGSSAKFYIYGFTNKGIWYKYSLNVQVVDKKPSSRSNNFRNYEDINIDCTQCTILEIIEEIKDKNIALPDEKYAFKVYSKLYFFLKNKIQKLHEKLQPLNTLMEDMAIEGAILENVLEKLR